LHHIRKKITRDNHKSKISKLQKIKLIFYVTLMLGLFASTLITGAIDLSNLMNNIKNNIKENTLKVKIA